MEFMDVISESLHSKMNAALDARKSQIAAKLLKEEAHPENLHLAMDYIFARVDVQGIESLSEAVSDSALHFQVPYKQLSEMVESAFEEESVGNALIEALVSAGETEKPIIYTFDNRTSRVINMQEAVDMLGFWLELNPDNRLVMEEDVIASRGMFEKYLTAIQKESK